jgi:hypothetical protein
MQIAAPLIVLCPYKDQCHSSCYIPANSTATHSAMSVQRAVPLSAMCIQRAVPLSAQYVSYTYVISLSPNNHPPTVQGRTPGKSRCERCASSKLLDRTAHYSRSTVLCSSAEQQIVQHQSVGINIRVRLQIGQRWLGRGSYVLRVS